MPAGHAIIAGAPEHGDPEPMTSPPIDERQHSPAAQRNAEPILRVLRRQLPERGLVLEIASGTGEHALHFARGLAGVTWQPTDANAGALASIHAWRARAGLPNLQPPCELDVTAAHWPLEKADAIVCINLLHIAPWSVTEALMGGAARLLPTGGRLLIYGPFRVEGQHTADSNARFDADLRARDPSWGIRDIDAVAEAAGARGMRHLETITMPANNRILVLEHAGRE